MTTVRFTGFPQGQTVTIGAQQNGIALGPATVSAWNASLHTGPGTYRVRTSITDETWTEVQDGDIIETVAPGRARVWVDQFADWATDDARDLWVDVDYGERYDFQFPDHADLPPPNYLQRLAGTQAGYYPGVLSGHAMRGTDIFGNQVLTATYDQGNGAPIGTLDQTVTVTVMDGLATSTLTFTVRLIHPEVYYADRLKSLAPTAPEPERFGTIYVAADGDFTGAPAARSATPVVGGVFHVTCADGEFASSELRTRVGLNDYDNTTATRVLFKAGQTFYPTTKIDQGVTGINGQFDTWYHAGPNGTDEATLRYDRIAVYDPRTAEPFLFSNNFVYCGTRFSNLRLIVSDYDVSDVTWREWWNIIRYTGKTGPVGENATDNLQAANFNGEILTNGMGVYTQVISDDGAGTLICRQVVDTSDVDDIAAEQAFFADGDTLTGQTGGATMTFVAAGSRQDRTRKIPANGVTLRSVKGLLFDGVQIIGASSGISGLGQGAVVSDCLIQNYWNYGAQQTGGDRTSWSESGVVTVQPLAYEGTPRAFAGVAVSNNRNYFNAMVDGANVELNNISHASRRFAKVDDYSAHYCFGSTYGGHGAAHQPAHRMATDGSTVEGEMTVQFWGCGFSGGNSQIQFVTLGSGAVPYTPEVIRIENCHLQSNHGSRETSFNCVYSNFVLRNCILDRVAGTGSWEDFPIEWIADVSENSYFFDPDVNAVQPVVEFCTFTALLNTTPSSTIKGPDQAIRNTAIIYRNNAFVVDQTVLDSIDAGTLTNADDPQDFDGLLKPLPGAKAYRSGTDAAIGFDATGAPRPSTGFSKGAIDA